LRYAARAKKIRTKPIVLMDPREALILSLKREVSVLQSENEHLRSALNVYSGSTADLPTEKRLMVTPPQVDLEKLAELEGPQLAELVRLYITENEALRRENSELFSSREMLQRDHEIVCRENERLLKKLEEVNSSPLISARPAFSAEILNSVDSESNSNIWSSSDLDKSSQSKSPQQIPESIQKELDKRQIKRDIQTPRRGHRRNKSVEEKSSDSKIIRVKSSESDGVPVQINHLGKFDIDTEPQQDLTNRRFSVAKASVENNNSLVEKSGTKVKKLEKNSHVFGSIISLTDEEEI
jgi:kinesin family protein 12